MAFLDFMNEIENRKKPSLFNAYDYGAMEQPNGIMPNSQPPIMPQAPSYWEQMQKPIFGTMPTSQFVKLAGGLASAIAPNSWSGRAGAILANQMDEAFKQDILTKEEQRRQTDMEEAIRAHRGLEAQRLYQIGKQLEEERKGNIYRQNLGILPTLPDQFSNPAELETARRATIGTMAEYAPGTALDEIYKSTIPAQAKAGPPKAIPYLEGQEHVTEIYDSQGNLIKTAKAPRYKEGGAKGGNVDAKIDNLVKSYTAKAEQIERLLSENKIDTAEYNRRNRALEDRFEPSFKKYGWSVSSGRTATPSSGTSPRSSRFTIREIP